MSGEDVFRTFHRDSKSLSDYLNRRLGGLASEIRALGPEDLARPDEDLIGDIRARYAPDPPVLGGAMRRGPRQQYRLMIEVEELELVLPIRSGDPALLDQWPDGVAGIEGLAMEPAEPPHSYEPLPPVWRRVDAELRLRIQIPTNEFKERIKEIAATFELEESRARNICAAYPASIDAWVAEVERRASELLALRRHRFDGIRELDDLLVHLPPYQPPSLTIKVVEDAEEVQTVSEPVVVRLPRKVVLADDEWGTFVRVVQKWGIALGQHAKAVTPPVDEYVLRDLLLATLRAVYPVAEGEVMHAGLKTDIYVLVDPSEPETRPVIAELKIWRGASRVHGDLDQHLDQLTLREGRGLILFFIRNKRLRATLKNLDREVSSHPNFIGWVPVHDQGSWRAVRFRSRIDPTVSVVLTLGCIHVPQP